MICFLPGFIVIIFSLIFYLFFSLSLALIFFLVMLVWLMMPVPRWRRIIRNLIFKIPSIWSHTLNWTFCLTTRTQFEIRGLENLKKDQSYLLICNHQGLLDILVLQAKLDKYLPQLRYFMKQELFWIPLIGQACYIMGYPFMKRYSKRYIKKHPEKRNTDIETTRKACQRFDKTPITLINYVEGTRFTKDKAKKRRSPYQHLLTPKAGGIALVLSAMDQQIKTILNTTIIYSEPEQATITFLKGKMKKIIIQVEEFTIPSELRGDYQNDRKFRVHFQNWLNGIWRAKDQLIDEHSRQTHRSAPTDH